MTGTLRCYSFHSVKGGVGKSTLSVVTALALAHEHPEAPVYLIDMDLTGTSLADVLPLEAPRWEGGADGAPLDLKTPPADFHDHERSRGLVEAREDAEGSAPIGVPFLNDYLLFETPTGTRRPTCLPCRSRGASEAGRATSGSSRAARSPAISSGRCR